MAGHRYLHTDEDLHALAAQCTAGEPTYVLFNNLFMGEDASRFQQLLQS